VDISATAIVKIALVRSVLVMGMILM